MTTGTQGQNSEGRATPTVTARMVVEAARNLARKSRDMMVPALRASGALNAEQLIRERMDLVMDCYLTGAAEMLKMLRGDFTPEPWEEDYQHEPRIAALLGIASGERRR